MDDSEIFTRINALVDEEHALERSPADTRTAADVSRLHDIDVALDQCWDLLRQRRARRHAGDNPDGADVRSERTVEGYQQ